MDLLCDGMKGQLHVDPCLGTGLHKWHSIFLRWTDIRGASIEADVDSNTTKNHPTLPLPASPPPRSSPPSLQPCLTVRQEKQLISEQEEKEKEEEEGGRVISYSGAPPWQPEPCEPRPPAEEQRSSHRSRCSHSRRSEALPCDIHDPGEGGGGGVTPP